MKIQTSGYYSYAENTMRRLCSDMLSFSPGIGLVGVGEEYVVRHALLLGIYQRTKPMDKIEFMPMIS